MPALSVVVPIYNVEGYLPECLASLRAQTFSDIEIICVNDGSTDGSRSILDACAALDDRIKIIDKENGGLSSARNVGILQSAAPYVCFLDSDDRFSPDACGAIIESFSKTGADVITFGAVCFPPEAGNDWLREHLSPRDAVYEPFEGALLFEEMSQPFAWRTACRTSFLQENGLLFDEGVSFGEDVVFHFAVYPRSRKTVLDSRKLYEYRLGREGSLMDRFAVDLEKKGIAHTDIARAVIRDWKSQNLVARYSEELLEWLVEFNLQEMFGLSASCAYPIFHEVGKIIEGAWGRNWRDAGVSAAALKVISLCFMGRARFGFAFRMRNAMGVMQSRRSGLLLAADGKGLAR